MNLATPHRLLLFILALWPVVSPPSSPSPAGNPPYPIYLPYISNPNAVVAPASDPVLLAAGDIALCPYTQDKATAAILDHEPGQIAILGDAVQNIGAASEYIDCFGPGWGRHKARIYPAPGNHDYGTAGAAPFYDYFQPNVGEPGKGYYSYELGEWHIIVLNSNCSQVGGCAAGSPQEQWLRADLAAHPNRCSLAYWHHPRYTSGPHGNSSSVIPFWRALHSAGVEIVLNGHEHHYERFAPQDPTGNLDLEAGIRQFVVGTGGMALRGLVTVMANSEVRQTSANGVLKLTLGSNGYTWDFLPVAGQTFSDSGSSECHD